MAPKYLTGGVEVLQNIDTRPYDWGYGDSDETARDSMNSANYSLTYDDGRNAVSLDIPALTKLMASVRPLKLLVQSPRVQEIMNVNKSHAMNWKCP